MLSALLQETLQVFEADGAVVFLIDDERGRAQIVSTASVEGWLKPLQGSRYELEADDFTQLLEAPWLIVGTEGEHTRLPEIFEVTPRQTAAYVKLQQEQRLIGMLAVFHKNRLRVYLPDELAFLKGLANQASVAITNAQLFENVRASRTRLQHLSKRLVEVQDSERRLMARELHDEIGQVLTGLQFILESGRRLAEGEAKKGFENAQAVVGGLIKQVRDLSMKLLPSMLEDMGLLPTLLWHFDQYLEQTGIEVSFEHFGIENRYPPAVELTVYRIIQEALTNTARYANIKRAQVRVVADDESIHLLVQDNGKGFDLEKTTPTHAFGLMGMRERAFLMGGQLTVESAPGEGTTIKATLPITGRLERRKYDRKGLNRR
jgi:signal transduction histidine kinase